MTVNRPDGPTPLTSGHDLALRRRPTGAPPPLPREIGRTGRLLVALIVFGAIMTLATVLLGSGTAIADRADVRFLAWIARYRTGSLTSVMRTLDAIDSPWPLRILRWVAILILVTFRRWRHLLVLLGSLIFVEVLTYQMSIIIGRPRPYGVAILTDWQGFSMPSRPIASLAVTLIVMTYALVPAGRYRSAAKLCTAVVVGVVCLARLYLAVDHGSDLILGVLIGATVPIVAFRWFTPNDVFPVTYRRGKTAHLDVSGRRADAIRKAALEQLGREVTDIVPVGLAGSGGSTPLRLTLASADAANRYAFAKLYAKTHVRADRWYKLGRQILYGALEDETPFGTVRRFVEYEDYTLRLMQDYGLPTPQPQGVVEISPEAEYMIVMEFFDGAAELGEADVDEPIIRQGLALIRRLWDAGLAHRDIKPANLMVQDEQLRLIDVFFVQVRPSAWRQAVDLANMMLVLALRSDAETVYRVALEFFTPEEVAEAFAATRGVASPTQLRAMMKADGRDLLSVFRALAPPRDPIRIQRWSAKRLAITLWVALLALIGLGLVAQNWAVFA